MTADAAATGAAKSVGTTSESSDRRLPVAGQSSWTAEVSEPRWTLTLYVSGASPRSAQAIVAVRQICDEDLAGQVDLTVINAAENPQLVKRDHILALPTLVKHTPGPLRQLVGNLTDLERVRSALDLGPRIVDRPPDVAPPVVEGSTS